MFLAFTSQRSAQVKLTAFGKEGKNSATDLLAWERDSSERGVGSANPLPSNRGYRYLRRLDVSTGSVSYWFRTNTDIVRVQLLQLQLAAGNPPQDAASRSRSPYLPP